MQRSEKKTLMQNLLKLYKQEIEIEAIELDEDLANLIYKHVS